MSAGAHHRAAFPAGSPDSACCRRRCGEPVADRVERGGRPARALGRRLARQGVDGPGGLAPADRRPGLAPQGAARRRGDPGRDRGPADDRSAERGAVQQVEGTPRLRRRGRQRDGAAARERPPPAPGCARSPRRSARIRWARRRGGQLTSQAAARATAGRAPPPAAGAPRAAAPAGARGCPASHGRAANPASSCPWLCRVASRTEANPDADALPGGGTCTPPILLPGPFRPGGAFGRTAPVRTAGLGWGHGPSRAGRGEPGTCSAASDAAGGCGRRTGRSGGGWRTCGRWTCRGCGSRCRSSPGCWTCRCGSGTGCGSRSRPARCCASPQRYPQHARRIDEADLSRPIHVMRRDGRWTVLDGSPPTRCRRPPAGHRDRRVAGLRGRPGRHRPLSGPVERAAGGVRLEGAGRGPGAECAHVISLAETLHREACHG